MYHFLLGLIVPLSVYAGKIVSETPQKIDRAYVPVGYDANDAIRIMVTGRYSSPSAQAGMMGTEVDYAKKEILIEFTAYEYDEAFRSSGSMFAQDVYIGLLWEAGVYRLIDRTSQKKLGVLVVAEAPQQGPGTDSADYLPLTDAFIPDLKQGVIYLRGVFSNSCDLVDKVNVINQGDVLLVLPITKRAETNCQDGEFPFQIVEKFATPLPTQPFLLHVRARGGEAIQTMVSFPKESRD